MIDLDALEEGWTEKEKKLYCHLALAIWMDGKLDCYSWFRLCRGLDLLISVPYEEQVASNKLVDALIAYYRDESPGCKWWFSSVQHFTTCCAGGYPLEHQEYIAELILDRVRRRMEK